MNKKWSGYGNTVYSHYSQQLYSVESQRIELANFEPLLLGGKHTVSAFEYNMFVNPTIENFLCVAMFRHLILYK